MGVRRIAAGLAVLALGCAGTPRTAPLAEELGEFDLTELALLVSGYEDPAALRAARREFEALAEPVLARARLAGEAPSDRARALLAELHAEVFETYEMRATSLADVLERRTFNCLSSAVVYAVLAERLGIPVQAELLPSHARILLPSLDEGRPARIVETTAANGFDPPPAAAAEILARFAQALAPNARTLVPRSGAIVPTMVLIGSIYVNRASIAQEAGDLASAERLFARGEDLASGARMRRVLRDQRAALLSQLAADDLAHAEHLDRAYQTLRAAHALEPEDPAVRAVVEHNLRAAGERVVARAAEQGDEAGILAVPTALSAEGFSGDEAAGLSAFAYSTLARLRAEAKDMSGALEAIERAMDLSLAPSDAGLRETIAQNHVVALRLAAMSSAERGEYARSMQLISRLAEIGARDGRDLRTVYMLLGQAAMGRGDLAGAAALYREGLREHPRDRDLSQNLAAVLERVALPHVEAGACDRAEGLLAELASLELGAAFARRARTQCLVRAANARVKLGDHAEAVRLLAAAAEGAEPEVVARLSIALLSGLDHLVRGGRCDEALALAAGLRLEAGPLAAVLAPCQP